MARSEDSQSRSRNARDGGSHRLTYQPALDGIRALAVAAVLAYHADFDWARGGFLGVDAFFVLSGFLITGLLLAEWRERGGIGLLAFWSRRARRLLPALFLMLVGVGVYAIVFAGPQELGGIRGDALATIGYVANWRPVFSGQSYFDRFSMPSPLRHTWSLGIEEQYYVIWPLLLLFLLGLLRISRTKLIAASLVLLVSSALLMGLLFRPDSDPSRVYYGTDTRAQSLLVGAVLAMLLLQVGPLRGRIAGPAVQTAGLACAVGLGVLWSRTPEDSTLLYRGGLLCIALMVAVVIAAAVQSKAGPLARVLAVPPLRALGLISYGVYLWHWPVYLMLTPDRTHMDGYALFAVRVLVTLAVATLSYRLLEMPIRRGAFRRWKMSWTLAPAGALGVAVALVLVTRGAVFPVSTPAQVMPAPIATTAAGEPVRVMALGDSVALSLEPGLTDVAREQNVLVWNRALLGCGFVPVDKAIDSQWKLSKEQADMCKEWYATWRSDVEAFHPDVILWLFGGADNLDHLVNGRTLEAGTPESDEYIRQELQKQVDELTSRGTRLALLTYPCSRPAQWVLVSDAEQQEREREDLRRITILNDLYRGFAAEHPEKVTLVDLNGFACPEGVYSDLVVDGVKMREDGIHFTPKSSYIVARWLIPGIVDIAAGMGP
jgi:peptidoglycan/LPS O-acetylase OafA/YrhL